MNRKARMGTQIMGFLFVGMLIIIGLIIWAGVAIYFGDDYDTRKIESETLNYKIQKCITENKIEWTKEKIELEKEFFETCTINKESINENNFIIVRLGGALKIQSGKGDLEQCGFGESNPQFLKCTETVVEKNIDGKTTTFFIATGSNQKSLRQTS